MSYSTPWLLLPLVGVVTSQMLDITRRQTPSICDWDTSKYNATGTAPTVGPPLGNSTAPAPQQPWIWQTGFMARTETRDDGETYWDQNQDLWLQTPEPTSFSELATRWTGCYVMAAGWWANNTSRAQNDGGDCLAVVSQPCRDALERASAVPNPFSSSEDYPSSICPDLSERLPPECQADIKNELWSVLTSQPVEILRDRGFTPACHQRSVTHHEITRTLSRAIVNTKYGGGNLAYDEEIKDLVMIITSWFPNAGTSSENGSSSAQLSCLRTTNITPGSRTPPPTPSAAYTVGSGMWQAALAVSALLLMIL
ncbi:MAG: hypothetical protein M1817_006645 [Caeruleum heppii]|nr:MAG: hypothetical protein M1817_006645 [Caeruleum heppii]